MDDLKRMVSTDGFVEVFWERLQAARSSGEQLSRVDCYERMEEDFLAEYNCNRFSSYDAFRKVLNQRRR